MTCAICPDYQECRSRFGKHVPTSDSKKLCARCGWGMESPQRNQQDEVIEHLKGLNFTRQMRKDDDGSLAMVDEDGFTPLERKRIGLIAKGWLNANDRVLSNEEMEKLNELAKQPFQEDAPGIDVEEFNKLMLQSKNHEL